MADQSCIFCLIIAKKIPAIIIEENDTVLVIKDRSPKTPTHYLLLPKIHIESVAHLEKGQAHYMSDIMLMAQQLSKKLSGDKSFRLLVNNGKGVGQSVFHLHCHFLAGKKMSDF